VASREAHALRSKRDPEVGSHGKASATPGVNRERGGPVKAGPFGRSQVPGGRNSGEPRARELSKQQTCSGGLACGAKP
jgi:hypothetical protein